MRGLLDRFRERAERFLKTDLRYLLQGGFWLTLAKIVSITASFLSSIAFANLLPEETYGLYRYVLSLLAILAIPTLDGVDRALTRSVAQGHEGTFVPAIFTKMRWGTLGGVGALGLAAYYYFQGAE